VGGSGSQLRAEVSIPRVPGVLAADMYMEPRIQQLPDPPTPAPNKLRSQAATSMVATVFDLERPRRLRVGSRLPFPVKTGLPGVKSNDPWLAPGLKIPIRAIYNKVPGEMSHGSFYGLISNPQLHQQGLTHPSELCAESYHLGWSLVAQLMMDPPYNSNLSLCTSLSQQECPFQGAKTRWKG
jgi:hypothetical protein